MGRTYSTFASMDTATPPAPVARFLWNADRYEEAVARGIFTPEDPIELIDGEIITHTPRGEHRRRAAATERGRGRPAALACIFHTGPPFSLSPTTKTRLFRRLLGVHAG
jgi:hypothetical protein